jgi:hypothetical protein
MTLLSNFTVLIERRARQTNLLSNFTVLIERRALKECFKRLVAATAALAMLGGQPAFAASGTGNSQARKIAKDLQAALDAPTTPNARWAKDVNGTRHVQVVIMGSGNDREMTTCATTSRAAAARCTWHARPARVTATLPAAQVARIAARSDVITVAPNRATARTASTLEYVTGTLSTGVRSNSTKTSYSGLDGTGIGIAVLDSGVMKAHEAFNNASSVTRVKRNVQMLHDQANWTAARRQSSRSQQRPDAYEPRS